MTRWKAFGIHLAISVLVGAVLLAILYFVWFPPPLFGAIGADRLGLTIIAVDVVVGPLLTLVVYKQAKKWLKFDLSVIALLQVGFLVYGLAFMVPFRPVFLVAAVDRFELVLAQEISAEDLAQASSAEYGSLSWTGPRLVAAVLPEDPQEHEALLFGVMAGGKDVHQLPKYYRPYADHAADLVRHSKPLGVLLARQPQLAPRIDAFLERRGQTTESVRYVPVHARDEVLTALVTESGNEVLRLLHIDPYPQRN